MTQQNGNRVPDSYFQFTDLVYILSLRDSIHLIPVHCLHEETRISWKSSWDNSISLLHIADIWGGCRMIMGIKYIAFWDSVRQSLSTFFRGNCFLESYF